MTPRELRWYGWGYDDTTFSFDDRPGAWDYLSARLDLGDDHVPVASLDSIRLRPSRLDEAALQALREIVGAEAVAATDSVRLAHSLGKSYRDLIHLRRGDLPNPTDAVVFPSTEAEVLRLLALAADRQLAVIPFGGGTSVVGGVEPSGERPALTVSLARLNRVVTIDELSQTVTAEAGILGPALEAALNARGFTLGHFPQSFEFSTLGGWIAARSAGEASTKYGKIEDRVVCLRLATPVGVVETRQVPASAAGPSLLQLLVGSEGAYGLITQATLRLVPLPRFQQERGLLFHGFQAGVEAVRAILQSGLTPAMARVSDEDETRTSFRMRESRGGWASLRDRLGLAAVGQAGYSFDQGALLLLRFEGNDECALHESGHALALCKAQGAFNLGGSPVRSWRRDRYRTPYLRDVLLDRGVLVDTLETAAEWDQLPALYANLKTAITQAIEAGGARALVLTHLSHVYRDGASLYVTFMGRREAGRELEQWQRIKDAATDSIMRHGGALSHHHGVGYEHARWLEQEVGLAGLEALRAVKRALDPQGILNPGKLFGRGAP